MKRVFASLLALALSASSALAMELTDSPPKFPIPWGNSAGSAYIRSIPVPSQTGTQNCAASLTDGFPALTFVPASAGGCPPFGADFNGILKQLSQGVRWAQAGGPIFYDAGFATAIGGYPSGAILGSTVVPGKQWISTVDNNATDPDSDARSGWEEAPGQVPTGTPIPRFSIAVPFGSVAANGLTIGDASSNATGRANADTKYLFSFIWVSCGDGQCPIFTSGGSPTTRGASAALDYAAHKALSTWSMKGLGVAGVDGMGGSPSSFLTGVPVTLGNSTSPGSILGENFHALTAAENGTHAHANTLTDPGHTHTNNVTDPGHTHANTLSDPGHTHANTLSDPGHVHSVTVTDPGHTHGTNITRAQFAISSGGTGPFLYGASIGGGAGALITPAATGIGAAADPHVTGVTINNASVATGVTINNASAGTGISSAAQSNVTGVTINNANSGSGTGHNTVMRSMLVYWNLKL